MYQCRLVKRAKGDGINDAVLCQTQGGIQIIQCRAAIGQADFGMGDLICLDGLLVKMGKAGTFGPGLVVRVAFLHLELRASLLLAKLK